MRKKTLLIILSLSIFSFVAVSSSAQVSVKLINPSDGGSVFFVNAGDIFDVQVEVDTNGESINGYSMYISIDDSLIQAIDRDSSLDGIQPFLQGDFLGGISVENDTHNEPNGIDKFQLDYSEIQLQGGRSGQGVAATLKLRAVADGTTTINFDFDPQNNRVTRVSFPDGSVAQPTTAEAAVTIGGGGGKRFLKVSGDNQTGMPNETLLAPYVVSVKEGSLPLSGQRVTFEVTSGGGNFNGSSSIIVYTDSAGEASATLTLGPNSETNTATATLEDYPGGPLTFTASAVGLEGAEFRIVSGDNQEGKVGTTLAEPYVVSVKKDSLPLSGQRVTFEVTSGGGNFNGSSSIIVYTDSAGEANATLTLGPNPGANTATATLTNYPGGPLTFTASAAPLEGVEIWIVSGDNQQGKVGTSLAEPFVVSVLDRFGFPAVKSAVTFQVTAGGGNISGSSSAVIFTDTKGEARATLTLGTVAGSRNNRVRAHLENGDEVTFVATAEAGEPDRLAKVSGDEQTGEVGKQLPQPFVVRITDRFGNSVSSERVTFTVTEGDGTINGSASRDSETGEDGLAKAILTLGEEVGTISVKVTARVNAGSPQIFKALAKAGEATRIYKESGDEQKGIVGQSLKYPLVVSVKDDFFNPSSGELVIFEVIQGGGRFPSSSTIMEVKTDSEGKASVTPILGTKPGDDSNKFEVYLAYKPSISVTFTASSAEGEPKNLLIEGGDNQVGTVGEELPQPLSLILTDDYGNGIQGALLIFEVTMGDGKIQDVNISGPPQAKQWVTTDEDGRATVKFTLGSSATTQHSVKAYLKDDERVAITFSASASATKAAYLDISSEGELTGVVDSPLDEPLVVIARDAYGNIVSGADVSFEVTAGGGTVAPNLIHGASSKITVKSGDDGRAIAWWTLGTLSGENMVKAQVDGVEGEPIIFKATAQPDTTEITFSRITEGSHEEQPLRGVVGKPLENPLRVSVKDKFDNPVKNASILFKVSMGGGKLIEEENQERLSSSSTELIVKTDEEGEASVIFILGEKSGRENNIATASVMEYAGLPTIFFTASAEHDVPATISKISGDEQIESVAQQLPLPLTVVVKDRFDNPVPFADVQFSVISDSGLLSPFGEDRQVSSLIQKTDEDGTAMVRYFNGVVAGEKKQIVEVKMATQQESPPPAVNFIASALPDAPASLELTSGDNQTGIVDTTLDEPLVVTVVDRYDNPVMYTEVFFEVTAGEGALFPVYRAPSDAKEKIATQTDSSGQAKAMLILGPKSGEHNNMVRVWIAGQEPNNIEDIEPQKEAPVILFTASAKPATGVKLVKVSGDRQVGVAGQQLSAPLVVVLRDHLGNPVGYAPVLFEVVEGGGRLSEGASGWVSKLEVKTDINGTAEVILKLGALAGENNNLVRSWLGGRKPFAVQFTASANAVEADELIKTSGDNQTGAPGLPLPAPFVVTLVDKYNNPISGGTVNFTVKVGSGMLLPYGIESVGTRSVDIATDEKGQAKATLTLPTSAEKEHVVEATTTLLPSADPITFNARTIPDMAANLKIFSGDGQIGTASNPLPEPLVVIAEDRFGNPISGEEINFEVIAGGGLIVATTPAAAISAPPSSSLTSPVVSTTGYTDDEGKAAVKLILGTDVTVINRVKATLRNKASPASSLEVIFSAMAKSTYATSLEIFSGDGQTNTVGQILPEPLVVKVTDQFGNPVEGAEVNFKVILGSGGLVEDVDSSASSPAVPLEQITVATDIFGKASVNLILGEKVGINNNVVLASPVGFYSPSLYFRASAEASTAHKLKMISGDEQKGPVRAPLNEPLIVEVTDVYENPVPSFPLRFAITRGDGLLEGGSIEGEEEEQFKTKIIKTDSNGRAAVRWILGPIAGENRLEVRSAASREASGFIAVSREASGFIGGLVGSPITFTAFASVSSKIRLAKISGDGQIGVVGGPLSQPLKVAVSDDLGNPIPEAEVSFFVESGSGKLNSSTGESARRRLNVMTDENGMAMASLTLGTKSGVENNIVSASILSLPSWIEPPTDTSAPVIFKATAEADAPQNIIKSKGDSQIGIASRALLEPLVVTILDGFLNPVKDAIVIYKVKEGNGKLLLSMSDGEKIGLDSLEAVTDSAGQAGVFFQLAKNIANNGENRVIAYPADAPDLKAEFTLYTNRPPIFTAPFDESKEDQQPPSKYTKTVKENELLLFTVAAIDPDGDELTILAASLPIGSTFKRANPEVWGYVPSEVKPHREQWRFAWRPDFAQSGDYKITFIAADTVGNTSRQTVSIMVQDNNRAPVMNSIPDKTVSEGETLSFRIEAADPDEDVITYTADGLPFLATLTPQTGEFSFLPSFKQANTYPITVYASDGSGGIASQTFNITVTDVNSPPKLARIVDKQIKEGEPLEFPIFAVDLDGDKLTFKSEGMPDGASLTEAESEKWKVESKKIFSASDLEDITTVIFSWTPSANQAGSYDVTITVTDVKGEKETQSFTINVEDVNLAPTFEGQDSDRVLLGVEGENIQFDLPVVDPEGGTALVTATNLPRGATFETNVGQEDSLPSYATVGKFNWTPDFTQAGNYEITFWATDSLGSSSSIVTKISVANKNRAPVIVTDFSNTSISEGEEWTVFIEASDPDGEPLEYSFSPMLEGASLVNGRFSWRPNFRQAGFYQLNFTVVDPNGGSDTKVAPLTVLDVNHPPTISVANNQSVLEGEELSFYVTATDADADRISLIANNLPAGANFDVTNEDAPSTEKPTYSTQRALFSWTPSYQQAGAYKVTFKATDNKLSQTTSNQKPAETTVSIIVVNVNQPPRLNRKISGFKNGAPLMIESSEELKIYEGDELTFTIEATDNDGDNLSYGAYNIPNGAVFNIYNTFLWMPLHTQEGSYYVRFIAFDGAASDYIDLTITVLDKNQPPQLSEVKDIHVEPGEEIQLQISATDVDGDKFEYGIANLPPGATFMETGLFRWTPLPTQVGTYKVTFIAKDFLGQSEQTVTIAVGTDETSAMSLLWDVNGDTVVDVTDLMMIGQHQGEESSPEDKNPYDVNDDGTVDIIDMVLVGMHFGETLPPPSPALLKANKERKNQRSLFLQANRLYQNYPNPFNPETWIPYFLALPSEVSISIYDVRGRLVKTLELGFKSAGTYVDRGSAAHWDASDENGERVASGVYFYKIQAGQFEMVRKMVVLE